MLIDSSADGRILHVEPGTLFSHLRFVMRTRAHKNVAFTYYTQQRTQSCCACMRPRIGHKRMCNQRVQLIRFECARRTDEPSVRELRTAVSAANARIQRSSQ